ncbi:hypothetical protein NPIL_671041 [Nephila pilipes]|uniref:Uncharacterized protein n=1 Tax=Nephila pilipes TaxID=299642 RepID=A0A8X6QL32_NEPPI|nr:hypothetical protein NPIL_671041 [Nephila pilipes]
MTSEVVHEAVSIPDVVAVIQAMNTTHQCLKADARIAEYIAAIPLITFERTEVQINYKMDLLSIQEAKKRREKIQEERLRLKNILEEKREEKKNNSTSRPANHTAPKSCADALSPPAAPNQESTCTNASEIFNQLKSRKIVEMFKILKKFVEISNSGKRTSERFTAIMELLEIDTPI